MARSDFNYVPVNHTFTGHNPVFETRFRVELSPGQSVVDDGYLVITVKSVDATTHRIRINGVELSSFDIPLPPSNSDAWFTYMDRIQPNILQGGMNTLQIIRTGSDNFTVKDLVVNWREE